LEGHTGGEKTQCNCSFSTHCDLQNSFSDPTYNDCIIASQAVDVPVNATLLFGSPSNKMISFATFYDRRGCEMQCEYENHATKWLDDLQMY